MANATKRRVENEDDVRAANVVVSAAVAMTNRLYSARRKSNAGKAADAYFGPLERRLRTITTAFRGFIADYQKRAPRDGKASSADRDFEIINWDDVPADRLKPYFEPAAIDHAIRMAIRLGVTELPGVRIYQREEAPS